MPSPSVAALTVAALLVVASRASAEDLPGPWSSARELQGFSPGPWYTARVTRYGEPGDPWSIHTGSCHYGYLDPNKATGWNVAAMSDSDRDFSGSCGRCYEIACQDMTFKDNYGQSLDRSHVCYDSSASVVVQITDSCPCVYPNNAYSNKRWCCGDMQHFDLSQWAFEKLADSKWGVIGVKVRWVPCDYQPSNPAKSIAHPTTGYAAPSGWSPDKDKRPWV